MILEADGFNKFKELVWRNGKDIKPGKEHIESGEIFLKNRDYKTYIYIPGTPFEVEGVTHKFLK